MIIFMSIFAVFNSNPSMGRYFRFIHTVSVKWENKVYIYSQPPIFQMAEPPMYLLELEENTEQRVNGLTLQEIRGALHFPCQKNY